MSDAKKTPDTVKSTATPKPHEPASREPQAAREAVVQGAALGQQATQDFRKLGETVADTEARTTDAAVDMGQHVAEQGREAISLGVRAAAGMNGRLADAADADYGRGQQALSATARALRIYQEAGDSAADHMDALFSAYMTLGRGLQQMQHAYLAMLDQALDRAAHRPQDLLRCKSLEELADVQRALYLDSVNRAVESSTMLLQMAVHTAQQAMRPLQARAGRA